MQTFPAHFTWLEEQPIVCIIDAEHVAAVNRAYEEEGEVVLVAVDEIPKSEMPPWHQHAGVLLIGPGGKDSGASGTGKPWQSFCWYAKPEIVRVEMCHSGPCTGAYQPCRVHLRASSDERPRTWWGYANGYGRVR